MFNEKPIKLCKKELVSDTVAFLKSSICSCQKYLALTIYGTGALKSQRECPRKFWEFFSDDRVFIYYLLRESVSCDWKYFFYVAFSILLSLSSEETTSEQGITIMFDTQGMRTRYCTNIVLKCDLHFKYFLRWWCSRRISLWWCGKL